MNLNEYLDLLKSDHSFIKPLTDSLQNGSIKNYDDLKKYLNNYYPVKSIHMFKHTLTVILNNINNTNCFFSSIAFEQNQKTINIANLSLEKTEKDSFTRYVFYTDAIGVFLYNNESKRSITELYFSQNNHSIMADDFTIATTTSEKKIQHLCDLLTEFYNLEIYETKNMHNFQQFILNQFIQTKPDTPEDIDLINLEHEIVLDTNMFNFPEMKLNFKKFLQENKLNIKPVIKHEL